MDPEHCLEEDDEDGLVEVVPGAGVLYQLLDIGELYEDVPLGDPPQHPLEANGPFAVQDAGHDVEAPRGVLLLYVARFLGICNTYYSLCAGLTTVRVKAYQCPGS